MSAATALHTEAARQQRLLAALAGGDDAGFEALGLAAYRANAAAVAERALAAACPTVQQLLGDESFSAVARRLWQVAPPARGDLAQWGGALPGLLAEDEALGDEPYLADVARVDLAVHRAEMAADATLDPARLAMLGEADPAGLRLHLAPGAWLLASAHPVAAIWQAHRSDAPDRFAPVRAALASGHGEHALVWRQGWRGQVAALSEPDAAFMAAVLTGDSLAQALDAAPLLDFEHWLLQALRLQWLSDVEML
ncbi:MAG: putative DNA-binding domain-containing protein [Burkholderiaceae bacterium]|nr:putative DNA-binding domain-containing protein [Rhodoferax sp.]MCP5283327.1 putative DNA-binding domain-containing protein [Burkholderiaceae bacterium]